MEKIQYIGQVDVSPEGDSAYTLFKVEAERGAEALEIFNSQYPTGGCSHEWDCCGCWFYYPPEIIHHDRIYGYFIIKQGGGKNI
jgi:hypothetical protein